MKICRLLVFASLIVSTASLVGAQQIPDLTIGDHTVQFHAFASQGYMASDNNNYLTAQTSSGTFAMTDFAANASMQVTDKLRVGAQLYDYNIGSLGNWRPTLDWGYVDYKFKDWLGIRVGKVKTVLGLYNDTQDSTFLYTWALMPQSLYPLDLRANSIAHSGTDLYGHLDVNKAGSLDYTAYFGYAPLDKQGGQEYATFSAHDPVVREAQWTGGEDLRWNTPIQGLLLGHSFMFSHLNGYAWDTDYKQGFSFKEHAIHTIASYGDYFRAKWHLSGEVRVNHGIVSAYGQTTNLGNDAWFLGLSYRLNKHLELGAYNSRIYLEESFTPSDPSSKHIFDQAVTARFDLTNFWNVKVEGHFMNGHGDTYSSRGFYLADNLNGFKPDTNLLIVRTGVNF